MEPIDLVYRYDPNQPLVKTVPATADEAMKTLTDGNVRYSRFLRSCTRAAAGKGQPINLVIPCAAQDLGLAEADGAAAPQNAFAVVLGCSDARVPTDAIFGTLRNHLFTVRVAGNVLSEECFGSIEYAVHNMNDSVRLIVVLGHTRCGAVSATVDTYLHPFSYLERVPSAALRSIVNHILMPVRKAADALESIWGPTAPQNESYRDALIQAAVSINAVQSAYSIRQELDRHSSNAIKVVYGVFDVASHRVWTESATDESAHGLILSEAPATLAEFEEVSIRFAVRAARDATMRKA